MKVFFFQFRCSPLTNSYNYLEYEGAFINCWIKSDNEYAAVETAQGYIFNSKWKVEELEEKDIIDDEFYNQKDEGLKYYKQALLDGECYVFHTWERKPS